MLWCVANTTLARGQEENKMAENAERLKDGREKEQKLFFERSPVYISPLQDGQPFKFHLFFM